MSTVRLHVVAEGQSEEHFVNRYLIDYLAAYGVMADVRCVETSRDKRRSRIYRGGLLSYAHLKKDLTLWIKQEHQNDDCWFTTMIDLYAFPKDEENSPYTPQIQAIPDPYQRIGSLEEKIFEDIAPLCRRFIPYVQLHEFEALTLCNAQSLKLFFDDRSAIAKIIALVEECDSPEEIDEGRQTAPSKRIIAEIPEYEFLKTTAGVEVAGINGIDPLRQRCPHFNQWIEKLLQLPKQDR